MADFTKVKWHSIEKHGMPERGLRFTETGADRRFLIKGEYSLQLGYVFRDGSGFNTDGEMLDTPIAWAIIEGF